MAGQGRVRLPLSAVVLAALGTAGVATAFVIAVQWGRAPGDGFTELWVLRNPHATTVRIGVTSHEREPALFRLTVSVGGKAIRDRKFRLRPKETWEARLIERRSVDVRLSMPPRTNIYRRVRSPGAQ